METNTATDRNGLSQIPPQPIAVAYFNRIRPVPIDHYLHLDESGGFFPVAVAAALIAAVLLLALD